MSAVQDLRVGAVSNALCENIQYSVALREENTGQKNYEQKRFEKRQGEAT